MKTTITNVAYLLAYYSFMGIYFPEMDIIYKVIVGVVLGIACYAVDMIQDEVCESEE